MTVAPLDVEVVKAVRANAPTEVIAAVLLRAAGVREISARLPRAAVSVAVRVTSDRELKRLNREFAGDDHATDVLSFAGDGSAHLGDIAISWPAVERQAAEFGHPEAAELALLCVHGLLHLLGWDHATPEGYEEMSRLSIDVLRPLGLKPPVKRIWSGYTRGEGLRRSPRA